MGLDNGGVLHRDLIEEWIEEWGERGGMRCEGGCTLPSAHYASTGSKLLYQIEIPSASSLGSMEKCECLADFICADSEGELATALLPAPGP